MRERSKAIDILRALAIFLVLGRHMILVAPDGSSFPQHLAHSVTTVWVRGGWIGVDLFFVLSGFLVSGLLFREHQKFGGLSAKSFLVRRGFKIYPPFWLLIGITVGGSVVRDHFNNSKALFSELLFVQNYGPFLWNHTWSLAVEEHFYLLLLLLLSLLTWQTNQRPFRHVPTIFVILSVLSLGLRIFGSYSEPYDYKALIFPSHLRMDSLFCGVLVSYYYHYHSRCFIESAKRFRIPAMILGTAACIPVFVIPIETSRFISTVGVALFYLGSGLVLFSALAFDPGNGKVVTLAAYIGSHSYSIYLWHMPVAMWLLPLAEHLLGSHWSWTVRFALYIFGSLSIGILTALLVEFPILRLRDHWFPSRGRPLTTSETGPGD